MYLCNSNNLDWFQSQQPRCLVQCLRNRVPSRVYRATQPFQQLGPAFRYVTTQVGSRENTRTCCTQSVSQSKVLSKLPQVKQQHEIKQFYSTLNEEQQAAVTADIGPICVRAGPGSGKTRVLIGRIAYLINDEKVDLSKIGAFTFTKKASKEMKERLKKLLVSRNLDTLFVGTFHSLCFKIIKSANKFPTILDETDQVNVVKQIIKGTSMKASSKEAKKMIQKYSNTRNACASSDEVDLSKEVDIGYVKVIKQYEELKKVRDEVDFDDLLFLAIDLLEQNDKVRQSWQKRFEHILVDEFQDTNRPQLQILKLLTQEYYDNKSVFVVGDRNQSIYAFRGSQPHVFDDFFNLYENAHEFNLIGNYRSQQYIVNASTKLNDVSGHCVPGRLSQKCQRSDLRKGRVKKSFNLDQFQEAVEIAEHVKGQLQKGVNAQDIAVLYRYHYYGHTVAKILRRAGINVRQHGAFDLWKRKEVKFFRHILQLLLNFQSSALDQVYKDVVEGLGEKTYQKIKDVQEQNQLTVNDLFLGDIHEFELPKEFAEDIFEKVVVFSGTNYLQNSYQNYQENFDDDDDDEFQDDYNGQFNSSFQSNYQSQNEQTQNLNPNELDGLQIDNNNNKHSISNFHQQNNKNYEIVDAESLYDLEFEKFDEVNQTNQIFFNFSLNWEDLNESVIQIIPEFIPPEGLKINKKQKLGINKLRTFYVILKNLLQFCNVEHLKYVVLYTLDQLGCFTITKESSAERKQENLSQALDILSAAAMEQQLQAINSNQDIYDILEIWEDQFREQDNVRKKYKNCVNLMTVHASKGLEFDSVVICGLAEGLFPRWDTQEELLEETRLMYVAITRAKNDLLLTYAKTVKFIEKDPSKFIKLKYD